MPNYRRNLVPGATYFFTANLQDRSSNLLIDEITALRTAIRAALAAKPFRIDAWVVLPDHMHCLWTLPPGDADHPGRWEILKKAFSRSMPPQPLRSPAMIRRRERGIWQRGYWEHTIRDERDYAAHMDYIHFNAIKHGLVHNADEWPFSTFRACVRQGLYPATWAGQDSPGSFGES